MKRKSQKLKNISHLSDKVLKDRRLRKELARRDAFWFFGIYFSHYIQYPSADFQREIFRLIQNQNIRILAITAFRGSAKSTICSLVLPIWGALGIFQKKHILLVCQTQQRAQQMLMNIKQEFENNQLLINDFGPFGERIEDWNKNTIVLPGLNVRITACSVGETVRGARHREHRPDLVICDDVEDVPSSRSYENRQNLWQFVNSELMPIGAEKTRYIFIGNKVHGDSVLMRLKAAIETELVKGVYKEYPLIDEGGEIAWPGRFPDQEAIDDLKATYASEVDYLREQMLKILPDGDSIIKPGDIHYYQDLPTVKPEFYFLSIDPAFSQKTTADKTAIIMGAVYKILGKLKIYILPGYINEKLTMPETLGKIRDILASFEPYSVVRPFVEGGSNQKGLTQMLQHEGIQAEEINIQGQDKESRLHVASNWIKTGVILFPETHTEELIAQILYFGTERYDDLVDALTLSVLTLLDKAKTPSDPVVVKLVDFRPKIRIT